MKFDKDKLRIRDPYILAEDGKYYMYGTNNMANSAAYGGDGKTPGFSSFVSDDLVTFDGPYHAFDRPDGFWGEKAYWAPEVHKVDGAYYMFATFFSEKDGRRCQILRSDNPLTGFTVWSEPITPEGWWCLDGTLVQSGERRAETVVPRVRSTLEKRAQRQRQLRHRRSVRAQE